MAEPTSYLSFHDMILRLAERLGMAYYGSDGQGKALIPIDRHNLDLLKQVVNDGVRLFVSNAPSGGWRWQKQMAEVVLVPDGSGVDNIDSDAARYLLPQFFAGQTEGDISYAADTDHGSGIQWVHPSTIDARRSVNIVTSYPQLAAVRPYQPSSPPALNSSRRWELIVFPTPVAADTLIFPYTVYFNNMDLESGVATGGSSTTLVDSTRDERDDYFNGWELTIVAGSGKGETATVTDYAKSTGTLTFSALSGGGTPDTTSVYYVQPAANLHPAGIAMDQAVLSACYAEAEKQIMKTNEGLVELFYKTDLPNAQHLDGLTAPKRIGNYYHKSLPVERIRANVTTEHDI